jgi:hypothetical protein
MAIVCPRCGQQNRDDAQFCANRDCGEYLTWDGPNASNAPRVTVSSPERTPPPPPVAAGYLNVEPTNLVAEPGEAATSTATVHNGGSQVEQFAMGARGPAAACVTFDPPVLQIYPGDSARATIRFAPPRPSALPAGRTPLTIRAVSTVHTDLVLSADVGAEIGAVHELAATLTPEVTSGRKLTTHTVELVNTGNGVEQVRLHATDPSARVRFGLPPAEVPVPPGRQLVPMTVQPPRHLLGRRRWHPFQVTVTAAAPVAPLILGGRREMRPIIPRWLLILGIVLLILCGCWIGALAVLNN